MMMVVTRSDEDDDVSRAGHQRRRSRRRSLSPTDKLHDDWRRQWRRLRRRRRPAMPADEVVPGGPTQWPAAKVVQAAAKWRCYLVGFEFSSGFRVNSGQRFSLRESLVRVILALVRDTRSKGQLRVIRVLLRCGFCYGSGQWSRLVKLVNGSGQRVRPAAVRVQVSGFE